MESNRGEQKKRGSTDKEEKFRSEPGRTPGCAEGDEATIDKALRNREGRERKHG